MIYLKQNFAEEGWTYFEYATSYNDAAALASLDPYSISPFSAQDEGGTVTFTITDGGSTSASKVYIKTVDGTAIAGEDYMAITAGSTAGLVEFGTVMLPKQLL